MTATATGAPPQTAAAPARAIYLVGGARVGLLPTDQAQLMLALADDLEAQRDRMTQHADQLAALLQFAARLRDGMAAAAGSAVRLDVTAVEEEIATFLLRQARARVALTDRTRYRHTCAICGKSRLSNPAYDQMQMRADRKDIAARAFVTPTAVAGSFLSYRRRRQQSKSFPCMYCYALDTEQSVVVFCPKCKAMYDKPLLRQCAKCHYDFTSPVDLSDVWRAPDSVTIPPPPGSRLVELQLTDEPTKLAFLPDSTRMLTASRARSVQLWDVSDPQCGPQELWTASVGGVVKVADPIVALSPDGRWVAVAKPQTPKVRLLRTSDGNEVTTLAWALADGSVPNSVTFWPDSNSLVIANAYVECWSLSGQRLNRMKLGAVIIPSRVAVSPDGAFIAASAGSLGNHKLFIWRSSDGAQLAKLTFPGSIGDLAWTPRPDALAMAIGNTAQLVQVPSGERIAQFPLDAEVTAVAVSADGALLAAASKDHSARVFDLRAGTEIARISRPTAVTTVAFAQDGRLAVGDEGNTVQFWAPPSPSTSTSQG